MASSVQLSVLSDLEVEVLGAIEAGRLSNPDSNFVQIVHGSLDV